jgi:phosphoribosylanthranilate isomerase
MSVTVKICGINSVEAADAAAGAGADLAGLNLHPASPRNLRLDQARLLADRLRGRVRIAVVVADARDETIAQAVRTLQPDFIQLHGNETPERCAAVRSLSGAGIIKALAIAEAADFAELPRFEAVADMILFDAKAPQSAMRPGGHGAAFDWKLLRGRSFSRPWLLAGGLDAENVSRAIAASGAPGVDVSSGIETAPGQKSPEMIRDFISAAKRLHQAVEERQ